MTENKKKKIWFIALVVLVILFFVVKTNYTQISDYFKEKPLEPHVPSSANIELYRFSDLSNKKNVNIELEVLNLGEEPATNISVFIRTRSQNGTQLFQGTITLSTIVLRQNESCTGIYTICFIDNSTDERHLYHTIEISWNAGRKTYLRETR
jgi:hypothetical protein